MGVLCCTISLQQKWLVEWSQWLTLNYPNWNFLWKICLQNILLMKMQSTCIVWPPNANCLGSFDQKGSLFSKEISHKLCVSWEWFLRFHVVFFCFFFGGRYCNCCTLSQDYVGLDLALPLDFRVPFLPGWRCCSLPPLLTFGTFFWTIGSGMYWQTITRYCTWSCVKKL